MSIGGKPSMPWATGLERFSTPSQLRISTPSCIRSMTRRLINIWLASAMPRRRARSFVDHDPLAEQAGQDGGGEETGGNQAGLDDGRILETVGDDAVGLHRQHGHRRRRSVESTSRPRPTRLAAASDTISRTLSPLPTPPACSISEQTTTMSTITCADSCESKWRCQCVASTRPPTAAAVWQQSANIGHEGSKLRRAVHWSGRAAPGRTAQEPGDTG